MIIKRYRLVKKRQALLVKWVKLSTLLMFFLGLLPLSVVAASDTAASVMTTSSQMHTTNSTSGAQTWAIDSAGVYFSLTQILPDQVRAFYINRGFSLQQIEPYANSCVFMTVLRNDKAAGLIHFVLDNWSIISGDNTLPPKKIRQWLQTLKSHKAKKSALIAFRWAQFPPEQEYEPGGDWNQGMLSAGLSAGQSFDAIARWDIAGKPYSAELKEVHCAK